MAPGSLTDWPRLGCGRLTSAALVETLQLLHAPENAGFEVHDATGVGEIARKLGEGAVNLSWPFAEIASLERDVLRSARSGPQRLAAVGIQQAGVAPGDPP